MTTIQVSRSVSSLPDAAMGWTLGTQSACPARSTWQDMLTAGIGVVERSVSTMLKHATVESTSVSTDLDLETRGAHAARLLAHAHGSLVRANPDGVFASRAARELTGLALREIVSDGQPTPQVAIEEDGGVDTSWLVNGSLVSLYVDSDGEGCIMATDAHGKLQFARDFDVDRDPLDLPTLATVRKLLSSLGSKTSKRIIP